MPTTHIERCATCKAPLVIREARPDWVVCCAVCVVPASVAPTRDRALAEWRRQEERRLEESKPAA